MGNRGFFFLTLPDLEKLWRTKIEFKGMEIFHLNFEQATNF